MRLRVVFFSCAVAIALPLLGLMLGSSKAVGPTAIKLSLDGRLEGPSAPWTIAVDDGFFREQNLEVSIEPAVSGAEAITRVAAGTFEVGTTDINALIRYRDANPAAPVKAIFIVHNKPAYAIIGRKSREVSTPGDLEEKRLGAPVIDPSTAQWPIFAKLNSVDPAKVTVVPVGVPVREPMLAAGEIDAFTGSSFSSPINLREKGVPADDITVLPMADYGLELYGSAVIVNSKFAAEKPEAVKAFLRAYVQGLRSTSQDVPRAVNSVLRRNTGLNRELEQERLSLALRDNVLTPEVRLSGLGGIDAGRFQRAIDQIGLTFSFKNKAKAVETFDSAFLPEEEERKID
jgi:NitT/TauT family transport system substrate-binding protein